MNKFVVWFTKITGYIPNLLYLRKKTYYLNETEKNNKIKESAIIISNHKSLIDFPLYMFVFFKRYVRPLVAEITYNKNKPLRMLLKLLGAIKVDRDSYDFGFMGDAINALDKGDMVLIFPEARIPDKGHEGLLEFKPSYIYIALESGVPIIPTYTNGKYGFGGKTRVVIGEKIYLKDLMDDNKTIEENIQYVNEYMKNYINKLKELIDEKEKK